MKTTKIKKPLPPLNHSFILSRMKNDTMLPFITECNIIKWRLLGDIFYE